MPLLFMLLFRHYWLPQLKSSKLKLASF